MDHTSYAYQGRQDRIRNLIAQGYILCISSDGYRVEHRGKFLHAAGVLLPRVNRCWPGSTAKDTQLYTDMALSIAERHRAMGTA